jgi:antitoxin component YwqK of YwqJK toxin-antitoxin module
MKLIVLLLSLTVCITAFPQKKEAYYDFFWKQSAPENASFYSITQKTDSGWLRSDYYIRTKRLQMQVLYEDEACKIPNGHCYYFHANGQPSIIGKMVHGKQDGICLSYYSNGMMSDSALFRNGKVTDKRFQWHVNGYMSDSISRINDSTCVHVGWFDNGNPAYAGYIVNGKSNGKWKYFHQNGQVSALETYTDGQMIKAEYFDESGKQLTDTSQVNREATMKGGQKAWTKYLSKNLYWPAGLEFSTPASVAVGISFWVDENGKITGAEVETPFHDAFDNIALSIIKNSPNWLPAISHNRKVKVQKTQPVVFSQPE